MEQLIYGERVHVVFDVDLPSLVRHQVVEHAKRLLQRCMYRFGAAEVHVHLKHDGPQIACTTTLLTDDGRFHARVIDWDVRRAVMDAVDSIEMQLHKHTERKSERTLLHA